MDNAAILVATAAVLSVWIAIFIYLWRIDAAARALRRELERERERNETAAPAAIVSRVHDSGEPVERR
ncbi:CcmD family protein [uncultured Chloroflexus sp.]|uniref:CcmD family protein n=1 Tax=uncultured Chloroflexus sp. TaxID=214040 RepID=UPI002613E871|nr:CcmD family protein [uncultured Chloroflexus sp.]